MATINRRQLLLGGGALLGSTMMPAFARRASAQGIERPEKLIRAGTNENPYGPSRVALQAIADSIKLSNKYGAGQSRELVDLVANINGVSSEHVALASGSGEILKTGGLIASWDQGSRRGWPKPAPGSPGSTPITRLSEPVALPWQASRVRRRGR